MEQVEQAETQYIIHNISPLPRVPSPVSELSILRRAQANKQDNLPNIQPSPPVRENLGHGQEIPGNERQSLPAQQLQGIQDDNSPAAIIGNIKDKLRAKLRVNIFKGKMVCK